MIAMLIIGALAVLQYFMIKTEHSKAKIVTLGRIAIEFLICLILYIVLIKDINKADDESESVDQLHGCGAYNDLMGSLKGYYDS